MITIEKNVSFTTNLLIKRTDLLEDVEINYIWNSINGMIPQPFDLKKITFPHCKNLSANES